MECESAPKQLKLTEQSKIKSNYQTTVECTRDSREILDELLAFLLN